MVLFDDGIEVQFSDLIDLELLQKIQDNFAATMGIASLTIDDKGPITKPSNFTDLCHDIRKTSLGHKRCNECNIECSKIAALKKEPVMYTCHAGLTHFAVPIIVEGKHIATMLGGQISSQKPDKELFKNLAKEFNIDEEKFIKASEKIEIISEERIKNASQFLYLVANSISETAHKNFELIIKNRRESLLKEIIKTMREALEPEIIKKYFVEVTSNYFDVDRCLFVDYDPATENFLPFRIEKLKSPDLKSVIGIDIQSAFPEFCDKLKMKKRNIIIKDVDKTLSRKKLLGYKALESLYKSDAKSDYGLIVWYKDQIMGILILHFLQKKRALNYDELEFLKTLRDHAGTALYQAGLYSKIKLQAQIELLIRNITDKIRSSLDIEETLLFICEETAKIFNVQRIAITAYPDSNNYENYIIKKQYKINDEISGLFNGENTTKTAAYWGRNLLLHNTVMAFDNIEKADVPNYFKETYNTIGVKSMMGTAIKKGNVVWGTLVLSEYKYYRKWSDEEENLLKIIADQVYIAINQAELYEKEKNTAERERLLRELSSIIRSTLDIKQIKKNFFTEIGKYFKADRCHVELKNLDTGKYETNLPNEEYLSSQDIKTYAGYSVGMPEFKHFKEKFENREDIIVYNIDDYLKKHNLRYLLSFAEEYNIKSVYGLSIVYANQVLGGFYIQYHHQEVYLNEDDIEFLRILANQLGIALHQAKLLEKEKKKTEQEVLIRNIIETIRGSLNIEETKKQIVDIIGRTFKTDRCFILEYNNANDKFLLINEEYLSSENIFSYKGMDLNQYTPNLIAELKNGKRLIVNEDAPVLNDVYITSETLSFEDIKKVIEKENIHSILIIPLFFSDNFLGDLVLHYVNEEHEFNNDEINFLNLVSNQIAIAIHQAKLYERIQLQAEREKISRNIIEILRSTLDKSIIKRLFVKNIGKYFNTNRVFFSEYDPNAYVYLPVDKDSEYLSGLEEKSFINYDFSSSIMEGHIKPIIDNRELLIPNWKDYVKKNQVRTEFAALYEEANVQSTYSFPVLYESKKIGYFCIEFTHKITELLDEDISRIRSICSQAGIALYHADLYLKTQQSLQIKGRLISKVKTCIKEPVENIIKISNLLSEIELKRDEQKEYLNSILNSCNQLMDLTESLEEY